MSDLLFDRVDKALDMLKVRLQTLRLSMPDPNEPKFVPVRGPHSPTSSISTLNLDTASASALSIRYATSLWYASQHIFQEADAALQQGIDLVLYHDRLVSQGTDYTVPTDPTDHNLGSVQPEEDTHKAFASGCRPQVTQTDQLACNNTLFPPALPTRHPDHNILAMRLSHLGSSIDTTTLQITFPSSWSSSPTLTHSLDIHPSYPTRTSSLPVHPTIFTDPEFLRRIHSDQQPNTTKAEQEIRERFFAERTQRGEDRDAAERVEKGVRNVMRRARGTL